MHECFPQVIRFSVDIPGLPSLSTAVKALFAFRRSTSIPFQPEVLGITIWNILRTEQYQFSTASKDGCPQQENGQQFCIGLEAAKGEDACLCADTESLI